MSKAITPAKPGTSLCVVVRPTHTQIVGSEIILHPCPGPPAALNLEPYREAGWRLVHCSYMAGMGTYTFRPLHDPPQPRLSTPHQQGL